VHEIYGQHHPKSFSFKSELAAIYWEQGRYRDAEKLYLEVLDSRKLELGEDHPDTVRSLQSVGKIYLSLGQPSGAETLLEQAHNWWLEHHGRDHPWTLDSLDQLAGLYYKKQNFLEAKNIYVSQIRQVEKRFWARASINTIKYAGRGFESWGSRKGPRMLKDFGGSV
jgi:tetratricopeptide (TPR) repeat protein